MTVTMQPQPKQTPSPDGLQSIIFGIYDQLLDHHHCNTDVVLVPAREDGEPDWERADPANVESLPGDEWPEDERAASRCCVIVSDVDGCDPDAAFLVRVLDGAPDLIQIHGPASDRAVAEQIIARDIGAEPPEREPTKLQASLTTLTDKLFPPKADNDNAPISQFIRGDRVVHDKFGAGTVLLSVCGRSVVKFDSGEQSNIIDAFLKPSPEPEPTPIRATPFSLRDPASLPEREWLYGKHYIRKYLTATVGAGGGGKSAHAVSEALAMITGRPLLDPDGALTPPLRVWYVNAEDPQDEIERRFHAAAKHFNVTAEQIADRLYTDSGRDQEFVIMRQNGREFKVCEPFVDEMVAEIQKRRIDVVIIDPFVSTHEVPENDNTAIQRVAKAWTEVADRTGCCVEVVHHVVKGKDEVTADSARGGGALKDKTRSMRTLNPMTRTEGEKVGIDDPERYFRIDFGKFNMVPSSKSQWRRFASVALGNGKGLVKTGDEIGVVESWRWPSKDALAERAAEARQAVVADVPAEVLAGLKARLGAGSYKADPKGKPWAGDVLIETGVAADRDDAKAMLAAWTELDEFEVVEEMDPSTRHPRKFVRPVATM